MAGGVDSRAEEYKNRVLALDHGGMLEMWELLCRGVPLPEAALRRRKRNS
jgi:hypothetical protein